MPHTHTHGVKAGKSPSLQIIRKAGWESDKTAVKFIDASSHSKCSVYKSPIKAGKV